MPFCFLSLEKSTKNVFYFTPEALFNLEIAVARLGP